MAEYFIMHNGQQVGPMPKHELINHGLHPNSMVWTQGMNTWAPAYTVSELSDLFPGNSQTPPPFSNYNGYGGTFSSTDNLSYTGTSGKSRLAFALFAMFLGLFGIQYFYVGKNTAGTITLILTLISCFSLGAVFQILYLIQGILVLVMDQTTFENKYVYSPSTFPLF